MRGRLCVDNVARWDVCFLCHLSRHPALWNLETGKGVVGPSILDRVVLFSVIL